MPKFYGSKKTAVILERHVGFIQSVNSGGVDIDIAVQQLLDIPKKERDTVLFHLFCNKDTPGDIYHKLFLTHCGTLPLDPKKKL